jgi:hypothetical protein
MKKIACFLIIILIVGASTAGAKQKPRKFYLTQGFFTGSQALTACADGYHMASLWEIFDVTSLRYDTTLGLTIPDSGFGPPAAGFAFGWIRTGNFSFGTTGTVGFDNCFAWTSSSNSDSGAQVTLNGLWENTQLNRSISPWIAGNGNCSFARGVWCVQDLKGK